MIGCLTETTTCVVAKPLVEIKGILTNIPMQIQRKIKDFKHIS